ncbi:hypothetical protein BIFGAL_02677 [Bifidobacterium gallicum DSM 20093 = LMG 11596]|uniref:Uncharacterized protein n=1 Tax=Bifidobacterium gallicum DSM 20093 = LMG 11596 TaxID=561180 RepID=D1NSC1_9BIFI|nr:hypothetical protein BIFGAL_02677 [Bifidobacterium gallicum DSM 20093 = LMG 11596]
MVLLTTAGVATGYSLQRRPLCNVDALERTTGIYTAKLLG